jgi:predicted DNA-binding transcriptional regulator AlpA
MNGLRQSEELIVVHPIGEAEEPPLSPAEASALLASSCRWLRVRPVALPSTPSSPYHRPSVADKNFLTAVDVARLLGIGERTVWRHRQAGRLPPPLAVGGRTLWHRADIEDWIREKKHAAANQRRSTRHNKHKG